MRYVGFATNNYKMPHFVNAIYAKLTSVLDKNELFCTIIQNYLAVWLKSSIFAPRKHKTSNIMNNYYITIAFYSEPNYQGNMTMYFLHGIKGSKISYGGTTYKKLYCQKSAAIKAAEKAKKAFPTAKVEINEYPICK